MKRKILYFIIFIILITAVFNIEHIYYSLKPTKLSNTTLESNPLILLHGFNAFFSTSIGEFSMIEMQSKLCDDLNYENKGIYLEDMTCSMINGNKTAIRVSYYGNINDFDIERYTDNLQIIVDRIKNCTGSEEVNIIAHSMGGIVTRNLIERDKHSIDKLIMLGTPNHGGLYDIGNIADKFAKEWQYNLTIDFIQLSENDEFMQNLGGLNKNTEYYTIAGIIDSKGDGIIEKESVKLNISKQHKIVNCSHIALKHPSLCPEAYKAVKEILNNSN